MEWGWEYEDQDENEENAGNKGENEENCGENVGIEMGMKHKNSGEEWK